MMEKLKDLMGNWWFTEWMENIKSRNEILFYFGLVCLVTSILFIVLSKITTVQVYNTNAWYKPFKFSFSIFLFSWTMTWYCHYLPVFNGNVFGWTTTVLLGFEIIYIAIQASKGELSHYNISTPIYSLLYSLMALAATLVTLYTAYVGVLFFINDFPELPGYYVWSIRWSLVIFVIFSLEGFVMGSRLSHTIGGADGGASIPFFNWSLKYGDPRIAHFIGMHALQILPVLSYYVFKNTKATIVLALLYGILALYTLIQALEGKPIYKIKNKQQNEAV